MACLCFLLKIFDKLIFQKVQLQWTPRIIKSKVQIRIISQNRNCSTTQKIIAIQKISSIHIFILKVQHILGSYELKDHVNFDYAHSKMIESTFRIPEFVPVCKKLVYSICSSLRYSQFLSSMTRLATLIFDHAHHGQLLLFVNLH